MNTRIFIVFGLLGLLVAPLSALANHNDADIELTRYGVRNVSQKEANFTSATEVAVGETVEFSMIIENNSSSISGKDVKASIFLPVGFRLIPTSAFDKTDSKNINVGIIKAGQQKEILMQASPDEDNEGAHRIQGQVSGSNLGTLNETVTLTVLPRSRATTSKKNTKTTSKTASQTVITSTTNTVTDTRIVYLGKDGLKIVKVGRNITAGQKTSTKEITAEPGDELEFSIQLTSQIDEPIEEITIKDRLPIQLDYIFNSSQLNKLAVEDDIIREGVTIDRLEAEEKRTLVFRARVLPASAFEEEEEKLVSTAQIEIGGNLINSDTAAVFVKIKNESNRALGGLFPASGFGLYFTLTLIALVIMLFTFWQQEKRRAEELAEKVKILSDQLSLRS